MTLNFHHTSTAPAVLFHSETETVGPLLACWRSGHWDRVGRYPDAVTDTTRRRYFGGRRIMLHVRRIRRLAIRMGLGHELLHVVIPLTGELYDAESNAAAREVIAAACTVDGVEFPAFHKFEGVPRVDKHAHLVTSAALRSHFDALGIWCEVVKPTTADTKCLTEYLAKPQDARAVTHNHERQPPAPAAAAEDYLAARAAASQNGRKRLPRAYGVINTPKEKHRYAKAPLCAALISITAAARALEALEQSNAARAAHWEEWQTRAAALLATRAAARAALKVPPPAGRTPTRPPPALAFLTRYTRTTTPDRAPPPPMLRR